MIVRSEQSSDRQAIAAVTERAFAGVGERGADRLVNALREGPAQISLVAADESGDVIGHVLLSRGWVDASLRLVEVLILSPLSVEPARQSCGIGGRLVRAAIAAASDWGAPALFLEGPPNYYGRFGFVAGSTVGFTRPSVRIPEPAFQVITLPRIENWMTGALVYPDAFWVADSVGLRT